MTGPDAPNRPERPEAEPVDPTRQAPPNGEGAEAPAGATFGASAEATQGAPHPQETSTAAIAPATASPSPVRSAPGHDTRPTRTPWLPPALGALLPRLAIAVALLAMLEAPAFGLRAWLARTHVGYDDNLLLTDGGADEVTALYWSGDGALYVGTRSGGLESIGSDGSMTDLRNPGEAGNAALPPINDPVQSFLAWTGQAGAAPVFMFQDRQYTASAGFQQGYAITNSAGGISRFDGGLLAAVDINNGTAVVGRAAMAGSAQQYQPLDNVLSTAKGAEAPEQLAKQQQPRIQPTGELLRGESLQQELPAATLGGSARYNLALVRDFQSSLPTEAGEIFGIEDVRAVAALPGTSTVISGDGEGNVFAIDASQQISGASPETYIRGIGQHETAVIEIAVAARPGDGAVLFATRAEDRTIKVWRGSVNRASQLIPLGDYPSADVTTPGSEWVREPVSFANRRSRANDVSLTALVAMSADGRRILARRANTELVLFDLPAPGEEGTATEYGDASYATQDSPAMLSPDGSRLVVAEATNAVVEMFDLSTGIAVGSFPGLAGVQFRRFAFDGTGQRFIAIATNGTVYVQTIATPEQAITLRRYQVPGVDAAISPDGSLVAVAETTPETSGRIPIYSAEDGSELTALDGPQYFGGLSFDASGKRLRAVVDDITGTWGATILTYSLRNSRRTAHLVGFTPDAAREGFLANGDRYLRRNGDAGYGIFDLDGNAGVGTLNAAANATGWVSNEDGSRIATLGGRGNISLFHQEESPTANGPMPAMGDHALRLSADGRTLIVGGRNGELHLARLDGDAGQAGYRLRRLALPAPALQYEIGSDGASIVTAEADGTVSISDLAFAPPTAEVTQGEVQIAGVEPPQAMAVADTIELPGHGAPVTAMALSPDGERLATASLDGRLRVASLAWARLVHAVPLAELPSGPDREKMEPQPLDQSPYALMSGATDGNAGNGAAYDQSFIVVYNARRSLGQAQGARGRAAEAGFPDGLIYRRQGFFRGVFAFPTAHARDEALPRIQETFSGAYARDLRSWCPNAARQQDFIDCDAVVAGAGPPAGAEPPPAMAN